MVAHRIRRYLHPSSLTPWQLLDELNRDFSDLFASAGGHDRVRVWASENSAVVEVDAPGIDPAQCDIEVHNETVGFSIPAAGDDANDGAQHHLRERSRSRFAQQVRLPFPLDAEKTDAVYEKGVLRLTLSRREDSRPARVAVKPA